MGKLSEKRKAYQAEVRRVASATHTWALDEGCLKIDVKDEVGNVIREVQRYFNIMPSKIKKLQGKPTWSKQFHMDKDDSVDVLWKDVMNAMITMAIPICFIPAIAVEDPMNSGWFIGDEYDEHRVLAWVNNRAASYLNTATETIRAATLSKNSHKVIALADDRSADRFGIKKPVANISSAILTANAVCWMTAEGHYQFHSADYQLDVIEDIQRMNRILQEAGRLELEGDE